MERKDLEATWIEESHIYLKAEADAVMDAQEARIKELEEKNRTLYDANKLMFEQVKSIADKDERIKELEAN